MARSEQVEELAQTLAEQVSDRLIPLMNTGNDDPDSEKIRARS